MAERTGRKAKSFASKPSGNCKFGPPKVRCRAQITVEAIDPGVIGAANDTTQVTGLVHQLGAAMAANVVENPHLTVLAPNHENGRSADLGRHRIAWGLQIVHKANKDPRFDKELGDLPIEKGLIAVGPGRQGSMERRPTHSILCPLISRPAIVPLFHVTPPQGKSSHKKSRLAYRNETGPPHRRDPSP